MKVFEDVSLKRDLKTFRDTVSKRHPTPLLEYLRYRYQEELSFVTLFFPFKSLEKLAALLSILFLPSFVIVSLLPTRPNSHRTLPERGELHRVSPGWVGQVGLGAEVGQQEPGFEPLCSQVWSGLPSQVLQ